ncbi:MAG: hypothetical protein ACRD5H_01465, partial [Nitrososphaerales archaeon]
MLAVLFVSTSYYGFVGPLYWHFIEADYFLDVYWGEKITSAATMIIAYSIFYGMCIVFRYRKPRPVSVKLV